MLFAIQHLLLLFLLRGAVAEPHYLSPPRLGNLELAVVVHYCREIAGSHAPSAQLTAAFQAVQQRHKEDCPVDDAALQRRYVAPEPYTYLEKERCGRETPLPDDYHNTLHDAVLLHSAELLGKRRVDPAVFDLVPGETLIEIMHWRHAPCVDDSKGVKWAYNQSWRDALTGRDGTPEARYRIVHYIQSLMAVAEEFLSI
jgi:hypothetical protein